MGFSDIIQPGLIQLQPSFDEFMDTLPSLNGTRHHCFCLSYLNVIGRLITSWNSGKYRELELVSGNWQKATPSIIWHHWLEGHPTCEKFYLGSSQWFTFEGLLGTRPKAVCTIAIK